MANYRRYCVLLLITLSKELSSGIGITEKYTCLGDTAYLFENITFDIRDTVVSLYKNVLLDMWIMQNSNLTETNTTQRVFLEDNRNICIRTFHFSDQGKYTLIYKRGNWNRTYEVQMNLAIAPKTHCIPKIKRLDDFLEASLERKEDCGKPEMQIYWQNNHGIVSVSENHKTLVKITDGKETRTYYACVEGPALKCARNSTQLDYCSNITIEGKSCLPEPCSEIEDKKIYIGLFIGLGVVIIIAIVSIILFLRKNRAATSILGKRMERPGSVKAALNVPPSCFKEICYEV